MKNYIIIIYYILLNITNFLSVGNIYIIIKHMKYFGFLLIK